MADYPNKMPKPPKGGAYQRGHTGPVVDSGVEGRQMPPKTVRKHPANKSGAAGMVGNSNMNAA